MEHPRIAAYHRTALRAGIALAVVVPVVAIGALVAGGGREARGTPGVASSGSRGSIAQQIPTTGQRSGDGFALRRSPSGTRTGIGGQFTSYHVPVLMYHRIAPASQRGRDLAGLVLDPRRFDQQLAALAARGWHTITSAALAQDVLTGATVAPRTFVITIDDGHADGYTNAFPILRKHGFVATFFIITGRVGRSRYLSWPELAQMQAAGMEIGNHTVAHVSEARFSRQMTDRQVDGAQTAIRAHLGTAPVSFAYPFGASPANLVASVMAAGLVDAFTTVEGANETAATALFWPRLRVSASTSATRVVWLVNAYS